MREFVVRLLKGRTSGDFSADDLPAAGRMDIACACISNAFHISNKLRRDTVVHLVLDGPPDPPKTITIDGREVKCLNYDERSIGFIIKDALKKSKNLKLNEARDIGNGITVAKRSFERLIREKAETKPLFYLHNKGEDIREAELCDDCVFVFGDYLGVPRNTEKLLKRIGAKRIRLGPLMLFASHCVILVHNELDRRLIQ